MEKRSAKRSSRRNREENEGKRQKAIDKRKSVENKGIAVKSS